LDKVVPKQIETPKGEQLWLTNMNPKINPAKPSHPSRNARTMQAISKMIQSAPARLAAKADKHRAAAGAVLSK
jgi:hypothetical protein